jgi:hypothetical protein
MRGAERECTPYDEWERAVKEAAAWSVDHDVSFVLGSFGSPGAPDIDMTEYHKRAMSFISADSRIVEAVWWSFFYYDNSHHRLRTSDGKLTKDGMVFVDMMYGDGLRQRDKQWNYYCRSTPGGGSCPFCETGAACIGAICY